MPKWSGGGRLSGEQHPGKEQKGKNDAEEVERVLCIFAISPWWWFRFTMDSRVVVVVSCYHGRHIAASTIVIQGQERETPLNFFSDQSVQRGGLE